MGATELTAAQLVAACELALPGNSGVRVSALEPLARGWETDNTAFTLEWGTAGSRSRRDLVIRVYAGEEAAAKAGREFRLLAALHRSGYPVPEPLALAESGSPVGGPYLLIERVHGKTLGPMLAQAQAAEQARLFDLFCRLLADLHRLDWRTVLPGERTEGGEPLALNERDLAGYRRWMQTVLPGSGFEVALDWLEARSADWPCPRPAVVHWDFHPGNVLVRADGSAVVIDWTGGTVADPRLDLAWTRLLLGSHGRPDSPDQVLAGYERHAGMRVEGIEYFDAAMAVRRLFDVTASLRLGPERLGMRPGAAAEMRSALPALRRVYDLFCRITGLKITEVEALFAG